MKTAGGDSEEGRWDRTPRRLGRKGEERQGSGREGHRWFCVCFLFVYLLTGIIQ